MPPQRETRDPKAIRASSTWASLFSLLRAADDLERQRHTRERYAPRHHRHALVGRPPVSELCALNTEDFDLGASPFHIDKSKTPTGARAVDIHPRLLEELKLYRSRRGPSALAAPAFPTRNGSRREKDNVRKNVIAPAVAHANELRLACGENRIRVHVTPDPFRRTYITFVVAAGYDIPYVQAEVGHEHRTTTLAIYAQVMRCPTATNYAPRSKPYSALHRSRPNLPGRRFTVSIAARRSLPSTPPELLNRPEKAARSDYDLPVRRSATTRPRV